MSGSELLKNELMIVELFKQKVQGKKADMSDANPNHDGKQGHWLEVQMGIPHNRKTEPDLLGFEMKNHSKSKTTFGDWSADYYVFKDSSKEITRDAFMRVFGKLNTKKNRYSWSGEPIPKINQVNSFGSTMVVDKSNNISIVYNYDLDERENKDLIVPDHLKQPDLILAKWEQDSISNKVNNKFNKNGWFKCEQDSDGIYTSIVFGDPISFDSWLELVKQGLAYFDSGMYTGNSRNYSQWRANNNVWESLVNRRYD